MRTTNEPPVDRTSQYLLAAAIGIYAFWKANNQMEEERRAATLQRQRDESERLRIHAETRRIARRLRLATRRLGERLT